MKQQIWIGAVLALGAAWIITVRLHSFHEPIERDIAIHSLVADGWLRGQSFYNDVWDMKPPAIFLTMAAFEKFFGFGQPAILAFNITFNLAAYLLIFLGCWRWTNRLNAALFASLLWSVWCGSLAIQGNQPNTEIAINVFLLITFCTTLRPTHGSSVIAGFAAGVAVLFKTIAIFPAIAIFLGVNQRRWIFQAISILGSVLLLTCLSFWMNGAWSDFKMTLYDYSLYYRQTGGLSAKGFWTSVGPLIASTFLSKETFRWVLPSVFLFSMGMLISRKEALRTPENRIAILYFMGSWMALLSLGRLYAHYYQLLLPPVILAAGWGIAKLSEHRPKTSLLIGFAIVSWAFYSEFRVLRMTPEQISFYKYEDRFIEGERTASELNSLLKPGETFYNWGIDSHLYVMANKQPPTGLFLNTPLLAGPLVERQTTRVLKDLNASLPEIVVISKYEMMPGFHSPVIEQWIHEHYHRLPDGGNRANFVLLMRKGGALERRLRNIP